MATSAGDERAYLPGPVFSAVFNINLGSLSGESVKMCGDLGWHQGTHHHHDYGWEHHPQQGEDLSHPELFIPHLLACFCIVT